MKTESDIVRKLSRKVSDIIWALPVCHCLGFLYFQLCSLGIHYAVTLPHAMIRSLKSTSSG